MRPIQRLLVANRGEVAVRIIRAALEADIDVVAVASPEDKSLAQTYGVSRVVDLRGTGAAAYLDIGDIIDIARRESCDGLHPGYGFLSENADLSQACADAGIAFVGPHPEALRLFGDKARARALATEHGVPVILGLDAPVTLEQVTAFQHQMADGNPILLKAVAGGGGRGIRRIETEDDLAAGFERCVSEALRSFGSGDLLAERLVEKARHIEIQVAADHVGNVTHLWERDCSVQRRYQKLVEIAPAPHLAPVLRDRLVEYALTLARASAIVGVATFEFLIDDQGNPYFIEANPRLQVEHTVTEEITGIDIVATQLGISSGRALSDLGLAEPPAIRGQAIQLRILAETLDSKGATQPSAGPVTEWRLPSGPGVRVDTAISQGHTPHPAFDSLVAKLIVSTSGHDHDQLRRRARRALADFTIAGPATNASLLEALLDRPELFTAALTTDFVEANAAKLTQRAMAIPEPPKVVTDRLEAAGVAVAHSGRPGSSDSVPDGHTRIVAPLVGTVVELGVIVGDVVAAGDTICVLESMKMEHLVSSIIHGTVRELFVSPGDIVSEADLLATVEGDDAQNTTKAASEQVDLDRIRPDLAELRARTKLLEDASRPDAVEARRRRGQRTARTNLEALCDDGSFNEYGALAVAAMRRTRPLDELQQRTQGDAIITGTGLVNSALFGTSARCALLVVDASVLAGTQGYYHHKKIDRILEVAAQAQLPVIFYPEGGGGRPNDTDISDIMVAGLNITSFAAFAELSGHVPRVAVVSGYCFAGSAAFAGCADVIIATKNACIGMGGPAMIEGGGLGVFHPTDIGPSEVQELNGVIDILVEDENEATLVAKQYLAYFQGVTHDWIAPDQRLLRHLIPENRRRIYDIRKVIDALCDEQSVLELRRAFGLGMVTALARIEGHPIGLIANDPTHLGGAIDDTGAEKAARFLQLCDAFGLPVVSLCDTPGFMVGPEIEQRAQVRKVSRLFVTGANISVPLICVITRKGYGLGAQAMAGGGFTQPVDTVAWPSAEVGGMGLEGAINLGFKKELAACETEEERSALFDKLLGVLYDKGKAINAASALEFDAVIDPAETRERIAHTLRSRRPSGPRRRTFVDTW